MKDVILYKFEFGFENIEPKPIKYQIEAKEDSFGCTVNFANDVYSQTTIKMELVRKNKTNKVLFDLPLVDFNQIVKSITKKDLEGNTTLFIPFNIFRQNLHLNKDNYLLITLTMLNNDYLSNTFLRTKNYVDYPIEIENKTFLNQQFADIDTKNFNYLFCSDCIEAQSVYSNKSLDNHFTNRKTYFNSFYLGIYMDYLIPTYHSEIFKLTASSRKGGFNPINIYLIK